MSGKWLAITTRLFLAGVVCAGELLATRAALAQSSGSSSSTEMEAVLFVQDPHLPKANPAAARASGVIGSANAYSGKDGIDLVWIPAPIQRLCLGKTEKQCSAIDYCVRTTNRDVAMCRNLGIPLSRLPSYPAGMRPRRQHSVLFFKIVPATSPTKGMAMLQDFYRSLPQASLDRLSMSARVRARIQYTNKADDDDLQVLEILAVAPF